MRNKVGVLTDYYRLSEIKVMKSKRLDCVASTGGYEPLEKRRKPSGLFFYLRPLPEVFNAEARRKAKLHLTGAKENVSSIFMPSPDRPEMGYGDMAGTRDALLFIFAPGMRGVEIFVARDEKANAKNIFSAASNGFLGEEMERLRKEAVPAGKEAVAIY